MLKKGVSWITSEWKKMLEELEENKGKYVPPVKYQAKKDNAFIDSIEELEGELINGGWINKEDNTSIKPDYVDLYYDCKCGSGNLLSITRYEYVSDSAKVKFLFNCYCGVLTAVRVKMKGLLKFEAIELWHCNKDLLLDYHIYIDNE